MTVFGPRRTIDNDNWDRTGVFGYGHASPGEAFRRAYLGASILSSCCGVPPVIRFCRLLFTPLTHNQTGSSFSFTGVLFHTTLTRGALLVAAVSDSNGSEDVPFKEPFGSSRHVTDPPRASGS